MQKLKFLIIDDHPLFREAMHSAVEAAYPNAKVRETSSMSGALLALDANDAFDLILLDLKIPDTVGFDGLLKLRTTYPRLPIVVVSGHEDPEIIKNVISYGAAGFIPKSTRKVALTKAIKSVMNGEIYLPEGYRDPEPTVQLCEERKVVLDKLLTLTPQQLRVITMIQNGLLNKQIAYELQVGETTVKAHVSEVLRKLGVNNRTQAAVKLSSLSSSDFDELNHEFDIKG